MNKHLIAALIVAASAAVAGPVFASGYGPASHYDPIAGAPASQRGQSAQTIGAEHTVADASIDMKSYGGVRDTTSQWGTHARVNEIHSLYAHR
jgi:hypothetical protein